MKEDRDRKEAAHAFWDGEGGDPVSHEELARIDELDGFLRGIPDEEPPEGFANEVMRRIEAVRGGANVRGSRLYGSAEHTFRVKGGREDTMVAKSTGNSGIRRFVFAAAAVVAAVALFAYFKGYGPTADEAAGTVGAAKRHRAEQITPADVKVEGIGAETFLQAEWFDRIVKDPAAREMFSNEAFRQALTSDAFRAALRDDAFRQAFTSDALRQAFTSDAFRQAFTSDAFRQALGGGAGDVLDLEANRRPELKPVALNQAFREALTSDAFRAALRDDAFRQAFSSDAFRDALTSDAFRQALGGNPGQGLDLEANRRPELQPVALNQAFRDALTSDAFRQALTSDAFRQALTSDAFRQALTSDAFREAFGSGGPAPEIQSNRFPELKSLFSNQAFLDALRSGAFRDALRSDAFRQALTSDAFRQALTSDAFRQALTSDAFRSALSSDGFRQALTSDAFRDALSRDARIR